MWVWVATLAKRWLTIRAIDYDGVVLSYYWPSHVAGAPAVCPSCTGATQRRVSRRHCSLSATDTLAVELDCLLRC